MTFTITLTVGLVSEMDNEQIFVFVLFAVLFLNFDNSSNLDRLTRLHLHMSDAFDGRRTMLNTNVVTALGGRFLRVEKLENNHFVRSLV